MTTEQVQGVDTERRERPWGAAVGIVVGMAVLALIIHNARTVRCRRVSEIPTTAVFAIR